MTELNKSTPIKQGGKVAEAIKFLEQAIQDTSRELKEADVVSVINECTRKIYTTRNTAVYALKIKNDVNIPDVTVESLRTHFLKAYEELGKYYDPVKTPDGILDKILAYFAKDKEACDRYKIDLDKSLLLYGGYGVGKTTIMQAMSIALKKSKHPLYPSFRMAPSLKMAEDFEKNGVGGIVKYSEPSYHTSQSFGGWAFDDIGAEQVSNHYGNKIDVVAHVVQLLESKRQMRDKTHFITNNSPEDIEEMYGGRAFSRIKGRCNAINWPANSVDHRTA